MTYILLLIFTVISFEQAIGGWSKLNDGEWKCKSKLAPNGCYDGDFKCTCPGDGQEATFKIGCCYKFPSCGKICNKYQSCWRYNHCHSCRSGLAEYDGNACIKCQKGFELGSGNCMKDLDECKINNGGCEHRCRNTYGSYFCECYSGYKLADDKHSCSPTSCGNPGTLQNGVIHKTGNWETHSYATFSCNKPQYVLKGYSFWYCSPLITVAESKWDGRYKPKCEDKCSDVVATDGNVCGHDISNEVQCSQLGCCYINGKCFYQRDQPYIQNKHFQPHSSMVQYKEEDRQNIDACKFTCATDDICTGFKVISTLHGSGISTLHGSGSNVGTVYDLTCKFLKEEGQQEIYENNSTWYQAIGRREDDLTYAEFARQTTANFHRGCFSDDHPYLTYIATHTATIRSAMDCINFCRKVPLGEFAGWKGKSGCFCIISMRSTLMKSKDLCTSNDDIDLYRVFRNRNYIGCFSKPSSNELTVYANNVVEQCIALCTSSYHQYAAISDGNTCTCLHEISSASLDESSCSSECSTSNMCGGNGFISLYLAEGVQYLSHTSEISIHTEIVVDSTQNAVGFDTSLFTYFPNMQTVMMHNLIISSQTIVSVPSAENCIDDCYALCGEIFLDENVYDVGGNIIIRAFFYKLSDLAKFSSRNITLISIYAQTVLIDEDVTLNNFALKIITRKLVINREKSTRIAINYSAGEYITIDKSNLCDHLILDSLFAKQIQMCSKILVSTDDIDNRMLALEMINDVTLDYCPNQYLNAISLSAKGDVFTKFSNVIANLYTIPLYTKSQLSMVLQTLYNSILVYKSKYDSLEDAVSDYEHINLMTEMETIYSLSIRKEQHTHYLDTLHQMKTSKYVYDKLEIAYKEAVEHLNQSTEYFSTELEKQRESYFDLVPSFLRMVKAAAAGFQSEDYATAAAAVVDFGKEAAEKKEKIDIFGRIVDTVKRLTDTAEKVMNFLQGMDDSIDFDVALSDIGNGVQLQMTQYAWQEMTDSVRLFLFDNKAMETKGANIYIQAVMYLANIGKTLTSAMIERAELLKNLLNIKSKLESSDEEIRSFQAIENSQLSTKEKKQKYLIFISEQSYNLRINLNYYLTLYCDAYFYINLAECDDSIKPSFGGSLSNLLLKINKAMYSDLLVNNKIPSTVKRSIIIKDDTIDPECLDIHQCPIKLFKDNRMITFDVDINEKSFIDLAKFRVGKISLHVDGAKGCDDNSDLMIYIQSSGSFKQKFSKEKSYNFVAKPFRLAYEYNVDDGYVSVMADVHNSFREAVQHITPFATWTLTVSSERSSCIDFTAVTHIEMTFEGSAVPIN